MLKATFPHLGNFYIPLKSFLSELGLEPVAPPLTSQRTVALGTRMSPEFACLPLKITLGNFIEAIDAGAECVFMVGGGGPCRLGYYGEVQREILHENGYGADFIVLEAPQDQPGKMREVIRRYIPRRKPHDFFRAFQIFWRKARAIDCFDLEVNKVRPFAADPGACTELQTRFYLEVDNASSIAAIQTVYKESVIKLNELSKRDPTFVPLLLLIGEIYMVLEPRVNFQIERTLGSMGVDVRRTIYITDWIKENFLLRYIQPSFQKKRLLTAKPYLKNPVGGHGLESVAHMVESGVNRYDGVIHLAPFTCMPEIVAMQIFPGVSKELSIPVLSLIIDEHSAEAGIQTKLEAFTDLLAFRNMQKKKPIESTVPTGLSH